MSDSAEPSTCVLQHVPVARQLWVACAAESKAAGSHVIRGEPLAVDGTQAPAPAAGQITGISDQALIGGQIVRAVELETEPNAPGGTDDRATQPELARTLLKTLASGQLEEVIRQLLAAGIHADRWSSPDLLGQLREAIDKRVDVVLCSAIDLDPALPLSQTLLSERALDVATGAAALARISGAKRAILALPEDSPSQIVTAVRAAASATSVTLYPLLNEYPIANASLLIKRVLGLRLLPGKLPTEVNVLLLDAPAAMAVARFFLHNEPMLHVPIGIYDPARARGHMLLAPVGMRLGDVLRAAELETEHCQMRAGHVLRDISVGPDAIVAGGELKVFATGARDAHHVSACLRCGWCIEACPVRIHPAGLLEAAQQQDREMARHYGLPACIECGICSYVCPSRLPLLESIRLLRSQIA